MTKPTRDTMPGNDDRPPRSWSPAQEGERLPGGYDVVQVIRGGMGTVCLGYQAATRQMFALKTCTLDPDPDRSAEILQRFGVEAAKWIEISRNTRGAHIVGARAFDAERFLLILEYVPGPSLHALCGPGNPAHPRHLLDWGKQVAEAMVELHQDHSVLHRDLKPANILVEARSLRAKVTDFGIVKAFDRDTTHATCVGTPAFMPPEVHQGQADPRSDIYSFGLTLLACATGVHRTPHQEVRRLSGPGRRFLERCVALDARDRFSSFDALRDALGLLGEADLPFGSAAFVRCEHHDYHFAIGVGDGCPLCRFERELRQRLQRLDATIDAEALLNVRPREPRRIVAEPRRISRRGAILTAASIALSSAAAWTWRALGEAPTPEEDRESGPAGAEPTTSKAEPAEPQRTETPPSTPGPDEVADDLANDVADDESADAREPAPSRPRCAHPDCDRLSPEETEAYRRLKEEYPALGPWAPEVCEVHAATSCTRCGSGYPSPAPRNCRLCGARLP